MKLRMKPHEYLGKLITFCGLDGCGKSTMIKMTADYFKNNAEFMQTKQPTNTVRKSAIFRTFMDTPNHDDYEYRSLSLFAASDRIQHSNKIIVPALQDGKIVLSDRYFYSCLANLQARGYENDTWIYEVSSFVPCPDIAFFFDVDVETAIKRIHNRTEEKDKYIDVVLQHKLKVQYLKIAKENNCVIIPSDGEPESTFEMVKKVLNSTIFNTYHSIETETTSNGELHYV